MEAEKAMESTQPQQLNCVDDTKNSITKMIQWSSDTNWAISHGSLENSINIESADYPIDQSDPEESNKDPPPVVLKPPGPDSGPCEIKIHFSQKYEICQIYVRSTARVYEVYYARSPQSDSEYLCTVRCGIAERDEKPLQATIIESDAKEHSRYHTGELSEEIVADGENIVISDDDWVKIKVPEVGRSSSSVKTGMTKVQDLYEATAQISDAEPCSLLTLRFLSLQDKSHVYIDEVYVFVDPVESTDSGTEVPAVSSTLSPLMAMLMPTLLQLSASRVSQANDKVASDEVYKNNKMESGSRRNGELKVGSEKNQVDEQGVELKGTDENAPDSDKIEHPNSALCSKKSDQSKDINDMPPGRLESSLEQLISRVSMVENICLRFEEKMLKPIQSMEARLRQVEHQLESRLQHVEHQLQTRFQKIEHKVETGLQHIEHKVETGLRQVEHQLDKLSENFHSPDLPNCTRISAPAFSLIESDSTSYYNNGHDYTKDLRRDNISDPSHCLHSLPGLVLTAPEFSCGEDEEDDDDHLNELKDTLCSKRKQSLSVDSALAAALSGFLSTAEIHQPKNIQATAAFPNETGWNSQHLENAESCEAKAQELSAAEDCSRETPKYAQMLSVAAPEFCAEEIGNDEMLNTRSSHSIGVLKDEEKDHGDETAPSDDNLFTPTDPCDLNKNEDANDVESAHNGNYPAVGPCLDDGHLDVIAVNLPESTRSSSLDFEFPILDVKFTSDVHSGTRSPLEALLGAETESKVEFPTHDRHDLVDDGDEKEINAVLWDSNGTTDLLPNDHHLMDLGHFGADDSLITEDGMRNSNVLCSSDIVVSLI